MHHCKFKLVFFYLKCISDFITQSILKTIDLKILRNIKYMRKAKYFSKYNIYRQSANKFVYNPRSDLWKSFKKTSNIAGRLCSLKAASVNFQAGVLNMMH